MLAAVEAGAVSVIYAYSLDRLARSTVTFAKLLKAAKDNNVRVVTEREGDLSDNGNPMTWAFGFLVSFFAEFELRIAKARAASVIARRRARGDVLGPPHFGGKPGEDLAALIAAFHARGSANGAAWKLNENGVKPRRGTTWSGSTVRKILINEGLIPKLGTGRGVKAKSSYTLSRLLLCPCGRYLTGTPDKSIGGRVLYRCIMAQNDPNHGRKSIVESAVLPWVQAELSRFDPPDIDEDDAAQVVERRALAEQRRKLAIAYSRGAFGSDDAAYEAEDAALAEAIQAIDDAASAMPLPSSIDWNWPRAELNAALRAIVHHIELNDQLQPVEAIWNDDAWRA